MKISFTIRSHKKMFIKLCDNVKRVNPDVEIVNQGANL